MPSFAQRARWHIEMVRGLFAARSRYARQRDWLGLMGCYAAHTAARLGGAEHRRYRTRGPGDPGLITLRLGTSDFHVLKEIFVTDVYGFARPALTSIQPRITTVLDLGANIGLTVRLWARLFPGSTIVAVEPDAANFELCLVNAARIDATVHGLRCFAGATSGVAALDRSLGAWAYRMADGAPGRGDTPVRTLPEIMNLAGLGDSPIDLLKCDVEGAEAEIFRGGPPWIARVGAILAEVHGGYTAEALAADVRAAGGTWSMTVGGPTVLLVRQTHSTPASVPPSARS
jgi:FkbM family methyltransferase